MSRRVMRGRFGAVTLAAVAAGLLLIAPAAQGRATASLKLYVNFSASGDISVILPDGTPVGTTSGAPTVIPAGFYTVILNQPGCIDVPNFDLQGPGVKILDNLDVGEDMTKDDIAVFQPNSTYTWRNDNTNPPVVFTFSTSGDVLGTPPPPGTPLDGFAAPGHGISSGTNVANHDVVGSGLAPFRGALTGAVSVSGRLSLEFKGKSIKSLAAGRYTIVVTDRSKTNGLVLAKAKHRVGVTGASFVGKRTASIVLSAGRWSFGLLRGTTAYPVAVH